MLTGKSKIFQKVDFDDSEENSYEYKGWVYQLLNNSHNVIYPNIPPPASLFKYYNNNALNKQAIIDQYCFCSHPYHLNDSMDCNNLLWDFSKIKRSNFNDFIGTYKDNPFYTREPTFEEDESRGFEFIKNTFWNIVTDKAGIISFSQNPLNTLMWSHYASEKGFMVEFTRSGLLNHMRRLNQYLTNYVFMPVQYVEELEKINFFSENFTSADIPFLYSINVKKDDWKYENEWRLICYSESYGVPISIVKPEADFPGIHQRKFFYDKNIIASFTLGKFFFNGSNLVGYRYPNIYTIKPSELEFINFIFSSYNSNLYISDESSNGNSICRNRVQIELEKLDINVFKIKIKK